jgi:hypothetical protein
MRRFTRRRMGIWGLCLALALALLLLWLARSTADVLRSNEGHDFLLIYAAARALRDHQNPYDPAVLGRDAHLAGLPWRMLLDAGHHLTQLYVYPPLLAWLVVPLTYLGPLAALAVWRILCGGAVFAGTYGLTTLWNRPASLLGSRARRLLFATIVTAAPVAVYGLYWGNPVLLVYAAMGGWIWALTRGGRLTDTAAGAVMSGTLLKPQVALPLAVLAAICLPRGADASMRRWRMAYGFAGACAILVGLDLLATGPALLLAWPDAVQRLSGLISMQPDMPSLLGLLQGWLMRWPPAITTELGVAIATVTMLVIVVLVRRLRAALSPETLLALLTVVWCFGAPYAHANDEILLVPGALALLATLGDLPLRRRRGDRPGVVSSAQVSRGRTVVGAVLAVTALGLLYLGGMLHLIVIFGHKPPFNVAGLVALILLAALALSLPSVTRQRTAAIRSDVLLTLEPAREAS